ncbi:MAG: hypothetical protein AMXMBFR79_15590 [Chitinophagaceae bacterium]
MGGIQQTPQKVEKTNTTTGVKYIDYKTNNPDLFFQNLNSTMRARR